MARTLVVWFALTASTYTLAVAGDWLSFGGDPQHSAWQKRGKQLSAANVKDVKLLWKQQLDTGGATAPVIVGPTITHRGVRELVFAGGGSDNFYAIDADLGTVFWKRHFDVAGDQPTGSQCASGLMPTPVIEPGAERDKDREDDEPGSMKPIYVVAGDGRLHRIRPSDGADMAAPGEFLPRGAHASHLNFASQNVYTTTPDACQGVPSGIWAVEVKAEQARPNLFPVKGGLIDAAVSIGTSGRIYCTLGDRILSLSSGSLRLGDSFSAPGRLTLSPVPFMWQGRELIAAGWSRGLFLLDGLHLNRVAAMESPMGDGAAGMATGLDSSGTRWLYAVADSRIIAYKLTGTSEHPRLERAWESAASGPPALSNRLVFAMTNAGGHASLIALDALSGRQLYSSGDTIPSSASSPALSVANGHICFTTADGVLYCFGIPVE